MVGILPAAVSFAVEGAPPAMVDGETASLLLQTQSGGNRASTEAVDQAIAKIVREKREPRNLGVLSDGNGATSGLMAGFAMSLFGPRTSSLTYGFLALLGASTLAFLRAFPGREVWFLPLIFSGLTLLLLTPLTTNQDIAAQIPIGGVRYSSILGIIPALHIFLEIRTRFRWSRLVELSLQAAVLLFAVLIRGAAIYLLIPIVVAAFVWSRNMTWSQWLREHGARVITIVVVATSCTVLVLIAVHDAVAAGRFGGVVWHRAFISFGINPDWPFGDIHRRYDCSADIPAGVTPGINDQNAHCVWSVIETGRHRPPGEIAAKIYDSDYESALRAAFFDVVRNYPVESLETFLIYKPALAVQSLFSLLHLDLAAIDPVVAAVAVFELVLVFALATDAMSAVGLPIAAAFTLCSFLPQELAWGNWWTVADPFLWMLCLAVNLLSLMYELARRFLARRLPSHIDTG